MKKLLITAGFIGGAGAALVLYFFDPASVRIYPVCMFHQLTGLDCPGCGGLRAAHELLHGHVVAALHLNLLLVLSLPLFAWLGVRFLQGELRSRPQLTFRPVWVWVYLAAWVTFGIVRNLPVHLLASFAP